MWHMKHFLAWACVVLVSSSVFGQDKTYSTGMLPFQLTDDQVAVLPCRPDMLICDLNRELVNRENRELGDISETLRQSMTDAVAEQCMAFATGQVHEPLAEHREGYQQLFGQASYQELPVPQSQESPERLQRIKALLETSQGSPDAGTRVEQGQLRTYFGKGETFMQLVLRNDSAVAGIQAQTQFDYLVCINEIDIRVLRQHEAEMGQDWDRRVKVHYTIFDPDGKTVAGGAAYSTYAGTEKGIEPLIRTEFPKVAAQIAAELVKLAPEVTSPAAPVPTTTQTNKRKAKAKNADDDF